MVKQTDPYQITNTNSTEWHNNRKTQRAWAQKFSLRKAYWIHTIHTSEIHYMH